jgi:glycosyltransferase involved in cell wall biosynthesis
MSSLTVGCGASDGKALDTSECRPGGGMRVAIVHDYLTQRGGAERVVLAMLRAFPDAELHTSLYEPASTFPEFRKYRVRTLPINAIRPLRRHHRAALPLLAPAFSAYRIDADLVICSSSGWAHGVRTTGRKVVYCYSPARWLYQRARYVGCHGGLRRMSMSAAIGALGGPLRQWDQRAARRADAYIAVSGFVRDELRRVYGIDATILHPPSRDLRTYPRQPIAGVAPGFLLCVSRLLPYKNVDVLLEAMRRLPEHRLMVAGSGPEATRLASMAPPNATLLGTVSDEQLAWLYESCGAVVAPSHEDYGLVPIEAALFGKPTAALRGGGFLDTVVHGETGILFDALDPGVIAGAAVEALELKTPPPCIVVHARGFSEERFAEQLRALSTQGLRHAPSAAHPASRSLTRRARPDG